MENMNNYYDNQGFGPEMPTSTGKVSVNDMFDSPYYSTYLNAWDDRFLTMDKIQEIEQQKQAAAEAAAVPVVKELPVRRLFPMLMILLFSLAALAVAVAGAIKISAVAEYTVFSGNAAYADVLVLIDCLTKAGSTTLEGIFELVLPIALFLSLALVLLMFILSFAALCSRKCRIGIIGLSLITFLLGVLSAVSLYIAMGAPDLVGEFFAFGGKDAIGYGLVGILGCELLAFVFSLFANRPAKKAA